MANFRIFIEGDGSEKVFVQHLINYLDIVKPGDTVDYVTVGGWTKIDLVRNKFEENTDAGGVNIVIFDADDADKDPIHGGFTARASRIRQVLTGYSFNLFLYPNDQDDGDFELLLENIINPPHRPVIDCFEGYEACLSGHKDENTGEDLYNSPLRKSKIYAYVDAFPKSNADNEKFKKGNFFFDNNYIWNLDCSTIQSLKDFLSNIFNT